MRTAVTTVSMPWHHQIITILGSFLHTPSEDDHRALIEKLPRMGIMVLWFISIWCLPLDDEHEEQPSALSSPVNPTLPPLSTSIILLLFADNSITVIDGVVTSG